MTDGFTPRPRVEGGARNENDRSNTVTELAKIALRLDTKVVGTARSAFADGSDSYDAASMVVVRVFGLLERAENAALLDVLTTTERRALRAVRNIITHGGYATMDDESFWETATVHLPEVVRRLQAAAEERGR